jgi:hypothetical protein
MLIYDSPVAGAKRAAKDFAYNIQGDLDDSVGGIAWWRDFPLSAQTRAVLSHYTISVARGVEANLDEAAFHCFRYQERIQVENNFVTSRYRQANGQLPDLRSGQKIDRRRQTEIRAHQGAFFRSIGSVLDTLTGVVIAVGALELDLLRADFGMLRTSDPSASYPRLSGDAGRILRKALADEGTDQAHAQESLLRSVRAAVTAAGPPGWAQWTLDTRNNFVHRPRWMSVVMHDQPTRTSPINWIRPLPRTPAGAAPLDEELGKVVASRLDCRVLQGYGMSELSPVSHYIAHEEAEVPLSSVGRPVANTENKLVDPATGDEIIIPNVGVSAPGELWIKGPNVMVGYLGNETATSETLDADGFLHTGDIATVDESGAVYIVDRLKELIKYKGYQVPPAELEALLLSHPQIADAAVIGVTNGDGEELPKAYVVR